MSRQKNVLWILCDQLRAQALSINGDSNVHTPNIDILARTGVNFTHAVSGAPLCCPYRGSMLTSRYPHECVPGHQRQLDPAQPTIAQVFNDHGYDTYYLGKWHLDGAKEEHERTTIHYIPPDRRGGFGSWLGYENNNSQWDCYIHGHKDGKEVGMTRLPGYETDALTDMMIDYLHERAGDEKPFFAVLSVQPPHDPYAAPAEFLGKHSPAGVRFRENVPDVKRVRDQASLELSGYYAMIEDLDYNVGRLMAALDADHILDDTHIIFFSDHGDMHGSHGQFRKTTMYEESVRVPFIIGGESREYCNGRRTGNIDDILVNHVDVAPTTLGLCGIPVPDWMQGFDYSYCRLTDKPKPENVPQSAYIQLVIPTCHWDSVNRAFRGVVTADGYKYACFEGQDWLLFNLGEDPFEQVNLAYNGLFAGLRHRMQEELRAWAEKTGDSFLIPNL